MATETFFLPGYGVVVDAEDGDEVFIPGYGVVVNNEAPAVSFPPWKASIIHLLAR